MADHDDYDGGMRMDDESNPQMAVDNLEFTDALEVAEVSSLYVCCTQSCFSYSALLFFIDGDW